MIKIFQFIARNTLMNSSTVALIKVLFVIIPLCLGLFTYDYLCVDFCKSLFLYSAALAFDMGIKCGQVSASKSNGIFLYIVVMLIFASSIVLTGVAFLGILNNEWILSIDLLEKIKKCVYIFVLAQAFWYSIETVLLFFGEIIKKLLQKVPVKVSQSSDWKYNI